MISVQPSEQEIQQWRTNWTIDHNRKMFLTTIWPPEMIQDFLREHVESMAKNLAAAFATGGILAVPNMSGPCPDCDYNGQEFISPSDCGEVDADCVCRRPKGHAGLHSEDPHYHEDFEYNGPEQDAVDAASRVMVSAYKRGNVLRFPSHAPKFGSGCDL
jgi:hypothetical protein